MKILKRILLGFVIIISAAAVLWFGRFKVEDIYAHKKISDINSYMKTVDDIKISDNVNVVAIGEAAHGCKDFFISDISYKTDGRAYFMDERIQQYCK